MDRHIDLTDIFNLCTVFNGNLTRRLTSDPSLITAFSYALTNEDDSRMDELSAEIARYQTPDITYNLQMGRKCYNVPDGLALATLALTEIMANLAVQSLPFEEAKEMAPPQNRDTMESLHFTLNGAPTLARLFQP